MEKKMSFKQHKIWRLDLEKGVFCLMPFLTSPSQFIQAQDQQEEKTDLDWVGCATWGLRMFQIHKHKAGMKPLTLCLETDLLSTFFFFTSRGEGYWTFSNLNRLFKTELTLSILMNLKPQLLRPTGLNLLPSFIILNIECCSIWSRLLHHMI